MFFLCVIKRLNTVQAAQRSFEAYLEKKFFNAPPSSLPNFFLIALQRSYFSVAQRLTLPKQLNRKRTKEAHSGKKLPQFKHNAPPPGGGH